MNNLQKEKVYRLRTTGNSYHRISEIMQLPIGTIKSYCSRNGIKPNPISTEDLCLNCGRQLVQKTKQKPRKFCSDKCRMNWWSNNREQRKSKGNTHQCKNCNKEYYSYNNGSKYCSHSCYISHRFKRNGDHCEA